MRILLAILLLAVIAMPAMAQDHYLVRWKKNEQCAILTKLPFFGAHWVELGVYGTRWEAERALILNRKRGECPERPAKDANPK